MPCLLAELSFPHASYIVQDVCMADIVWGATCILNNQNITDEQKLKFGYLANNRLFLNKKNEKSVIYQTTKMRN